MIEEVLKVTKGVGAQMVCWILPYSANRNRTELPGVTVHNRTAQHIKLKLTELDLVCFTLVLRG